MEKIATLETTTSLVDDLCLEMKDVKADRTRLQEELKSKNILIEKVCRHFYQLCSAVIWLFIIIYCLLCFG